ncbi:MAG TPA: aspartate carbamoyltransferase regulatory subunit [Methanoregula sp.]|nr:aspartate carbamoyltransferase regulatory subunit [Methanoregula sp.]
MKSQEKAESAGNEGLLVRRIRNGTVIDHIDSGEALNVVKILGITGTTQEALSIATNVQSREMGKKDIVKLANRELSKEEVDRIALISPRATINIVRDFKVCEKKGVETPSLIVGIVRCPNPGCISNTNEPIASKFRVTGKGLRCIYCDWVITRDITSHII